MPLVDHLSLGVSDIARALSFYDPVLACLGCDRLEAGDDYACYGKDRVEFLLLLPYDGQQATGGNGTHLAFAAPSKEAVVAFFETGLKVGGTDEGRPGIRSDYPFAKAYAAYIRDPFGNKLEAIHNGFSVKRS